MAATVKFLQDLQSEITCSICRGYFCEPVTIGCGHSFCQACLSSSWRVGAPVFSCPECRRVSHNREIPLVNMRLVELTELGKELSSKILQSIEGQSQYVTHKKFCKLLCDEDQTALCVTCWETPDHGAHKISPVQEAAHKYRRELEHIQTCLGKHLEEDEQLLAQVKRPAVDWYWLIRAEFYQLRRLLMEEENRCLDRIRQEQKASQDRLSQHMQSLHDLMQELQEVGHQANMDMLQHARQLLGRSESILAQRAKAVIPELKEYPIPGLIEMLNRFRVDLTLDPTSADSCVSVLWDLKSAKAEEDWQVETEDTSCHPVLARQAFRSGSQYWEVDVAQLPQWVLGIYTPYLRRKRTRNMDICDFAFLLRCIKKEGDYYLQTYPGPLDHRMKGPLPRVGVYLEYSSGTLAFYNVLQSSLIYKFHSIPFTAPVTPIFSPGPPLLETNPGPMTLCPVDSHFCACCYSSQ